MLRFNLLILHTQFSVNKKYKDDAKIFMMLLLYMQGKALFSLSLLQI